MAEEAKDFGAIGEEILFAARNELYMNLPYLDVALCGLRFAPGDEVTLSIATDGQTLYYSGSWLAERYLRSRVLTNRAYLHVILHCMLRHLAKKRGKAAELISGGRVQVNWQDCTKPDRTVAEGDTISAAGMGNFSCLKQAVLRKKGRICIVVKRFI